jgi:hypothetical protein
VTHVTTDEKTFDATAEGSITFLHPFDAKEDPENVEQRTITDDGMRRLKYALEKAPAMMLARPVILDVKGVSVGGNHRLRGSKEMIGDDEYPNFNKWVQDHHGIPFFIRDFESAAERREWRVRDNADYAAWTDDGLAAVVASHRDDGGDMLLLGLAEPELDKLLEASAGAGDGGGAGGPDPLPDVWGVVIECEDETQQGELLEELNRRGFQCRALL